MTSNYRLFHILKLSFNKSYICSFSFEKQTHTQGRGKGVLTPRHTTTSLKSHGNFKGGWSKLYYTQHTLLNNAYICSCRGTICSSNPEWLGCKPNELNTINLLRVDKKVGLLANGITASEDLEYEQA